MSRNRRRHGSGRSFQILPEWQVYLCGGRNLFHFTLTPLRQLSLAAIVISAGIFGYLHIFGDKASTPAPVAALDTGVADAGALAAERKALDERAAALDAREASLAAEAVALAERRDAPVAEGASAAEENVAAREAELAALAEAQAAEAKALEARAAEIAAAEKMQNERELAMSQRERELDRLDEARIASERRLSRRASALADRENDLMELAQASAAREAAIGDRERALIAASEGGAQAVDEEALRRASALDTRERELAEAARASEARAETLDQREADIAELANAIGARERDSVEREEALARRAEEADARVVALEAQIAEAERLRDRAVTQAADVAAALDNALALLEKRGEGAADPVDVGETEIAAVDPVAADEPPTAASGAEASSGAETATETAADAAEPPAAEAVEAGNEETPAADGSIAVAAATPAVPAPAGVPAAGAPPAGPSTTALGPAISAPLASSPTVPGPNLAALPSSTFAPTPPASSPDGGPGVNVAPRLSDSVPVSQPLSLGLDIDAGTLSAEIAPSAGLPQPFAIESIAPVLDSDPLPLVTGTGSAGPGPQRAPIGAGERVANLGADATRSATPGARYSVPSAVRPRATSAPQLLRRGDDPASDGEGASETETRAQSDDEAIETAAVVSSETTTSSPSPTVTAPVAEQIEPPTALRGSAYVQAGIFTAKSYGYRLIENLAAVGLEASPVPTTFRGNDAIRVRLGPFQTAQERQAAIAELRKLGVSDAIPVAQ